MRVLALALSALSVACGGPTVGEIASQEVSVTLRAVSSDRGEVALGEPDGGIAVTRAFVGSSAFTLRPCNEQVAPLDLGPRAYELISESPYSERVTTAVRQFCGVALEIAPVEARGVPDGASIYIEGTDQNGDPFTLSSDASFSLSLETEDDEALPQWPLLLGFDVATWLAGLPLAEDMSDMAASLLEQQLPAAVDLYLDEDDDGALDPDEEPVHTTR